MLSKEEIQEAAENFAKEQDLSDGYMIVNRDKANGFIAGYETARKHWEPKWVSVKERLPDEAVNVLWLKSNEPPYVGTVSDVYFDEDGYTHWLPLPQINP